MAGAPINSRRSSASSSKSAGGAYSAPVQSTPGELDFCNAFWVFPGMKAAQGEGEKGDWGKEGYEVVLQRMRTGTKTLEDLKQMFRDRASLETDYAKKLTALSRCPLGAGETGHLERAIQQTKGEVDAMAKAHVDLATLYKKQEEQVADFIGRRESIRKGPQTKAEKEWKNINQQRAHVFRAKAKYEEDARQINGLHAQSTLLQGKELDKATAKLDKIQQTVLVNQRDYQNYTSVLKTTTAQWNMTWKTFCDLCQDQEEERVEFLKGRLWDWANALSTVAMSEDESAERTRTALEQCDPRTDLKVFVKQAGTGNSIPDPPPFVDFKLGGAQPKPTFKTAKFVRSSTRDGAVKHSPSAVEDISRAFQSTQITSSASQQQLGKSTSKPELTASVSQNSLGNSTNTITPSASNPPSRFAVSPVANLRTTAERSPSVDLATTKPGQVHASAFTRKPSLGSVPTLGSGDLAGSSAPPARYDAPAGGGAADDEEDDPLVQALNTLKSAQAQSTVRQPHQSAGPVLQGYSQHGQAGGPPRMAHQKSQASLGGQGPPRSRPTSPGDRPPSRNGNPPFAAPGVGPSGRSPSPQPYQQNGYQQGPPPQQQPYGAPPAQGYGQPQPGQSPGPGMAFSPPPGHQQYASAASVSGYGPPPPQGYPVGYGAPPPQMAQGYVASPAAHPQGYHPSPFPNSYAGSPAPGPTGYAQQPQQQGPAYGAQQRNASLSSSIGPGGYGGPSYASPSPVAQPLQQQPARAPSPARGPPTGQYTDDGKPILFYVNAIYDYAAAGPEEFSFSQGDVIAVTSTDPDGWWQGSKVGVSGGGHLFPSNFTELLP